jgi:16S rRNA (cytidine1402-2'-O)-methyltransferase
VTAPGRVYLVPNLLGIVEPAAVLPQRTIDIARRLAHFVVETPKSARAFIKTLDPAHAMQDIAMIALDLQTPRGAVEAMLAPARAGHDIGLVSDAGCPGVADPGAELVAAAHREGIRVVPLVGPSALLLALMASGMSGQHFSFHGYLPVKDDARIAALLRLEAESRSQSRTQMFIETPYRNVAMLTTMARSLRPETRACAAVDLTLASESVVSQPIALWRRASLSAFAKRPAIFLLQA